MPGSDDRDVIARRIEIGDPFAIDSRVGDHARDIITRVAAALVRHGLEVIADALRRSDHAGDAFLDRNVRVARSEHGLGQLQEMRLVGPW